MQTGMVTDDLIWHKSGHMLELTNKTACPRAVVYLVLEWARKQVRELGRQALFQQKLAFPTCALNPALPVCEEELNLSSSFLLKSMSA